MLLPDFPLSLLSCSETLEEEINVVFLSEGEMTERYFYKTLFSQGGKFYKRDGMRFSEMLKTDLDQGITDAVMLVKKGKEHFTSNPDIDISKDKLIVTFDLDKLSDEDINDLIKEKTDYVIYGFTNPKFELLQLMCTDKIIKNLEKRYYKKGFPNDILEKAFSDATHINSKKKKGGIYAAEYIGKMLSHDEYDSNDLRIEDKFFSNVPIVLRVINEKKLQDFKQDFKKKGGKL